MLSGNFRKREFSFEEDECSPAPKQKLPRVDLDLAPDIPVPFASIRGFVVHVGDNVFLDIRTFRKATYLNVTRYGDHAEVKNLFNISMKRFNEFKKGIEAIANHIKNNN